MPIAATKGKEIFDDVNRLLSEIRSYLPDTDIRVRRLLSEADKLIRADAAEGYSAKAAVYQLTGNLNEVLKHANNSVSLTSEPVVLANKCAYLLNLGAFSAAQEAYGIAMHPRKGQFLEKFHFGYACGAFQTMTHFLEEAARIQLDIKHLDALTALQGNNLLMRNGMSEDRVAAFLDVAGEVLREQRMMFVDHPRVFVANTTTDSILSFVILLPVDADRAEQLDTDLQCRFLERFPEFPYFLSIAFESGLPSNERYSDRPAELSA